MIILKESKIALWLTIGEKYTSAGSHREFEKSAYAGIGKRLCRKRSALKAESALKYESALKALVVGLPLYEHI